MPLPLSLNQVPSSDSVTSATTSATTATTQNGVLSLTFIDLPTQSGHAPQLVQPHLVCQLLLLEAHHGLHDRAFVVVVVVVVVVVAVA